jgi:predicted membrane chloride channel (bestrophin family)
MRQFLLCSWKIILFAAGYAVLVILLYRADVPIAIPVAIPAMLGTALSILLGFEYRTNKRPFSKVD